MKRYRIFGVVVLATILVACVATNREEPREAESPASSTNVVEPTATSVLSPATYDPKTGKRILQSTESVPGQSTTANWKVTVLAPPRIGDVREAKGVAVRVDIRVKNVGREGSTIYNSQFELKDSRDRIYKTLSFFDSSPVSLSAEDINPGLVYEGFVVFDVPESVISQNRWQLVINGAFLAEPAIINLGRGSDWVDLR